MADRTIQPQPKPSFAHRDRLSHAPQQVEPPVQYHAGAAPLGLAAGAPVPGTATAVHRTGGRPMSYERASVDLSATPDLVVVYLGYRVNNWRGIGSLLRIGRGLARIAEEPAGRTAGARDDVVRAAASRLPAILARFRKPGALHTARRSTPRGGGTSRAPPTATASGTRPTGCAAEWRRSTPACRSWGSQALPRRARLSGRLPARGSGWAPDSCELCVGRKQGRPSFLEKRSKKLLLPAQAPPPCFIQM